MEALHTLYRPQDWQDVIGQDATVNSLSELMHQRSTHCVLLVGGSGVGKTTIARIAATHLGARALDIREINAAKFTGKDDMREITENLHLVPLDGGVVVFILDECHQLSKSAWNLLLKEIEEPPEWVYWFFCTTEVEKVPAAVLTRSVRYNLQPVPWEEILDKIVRPVADVEKIECSDEILGMIARAADGSPRQALVFLAACRNTTSIDEARQLCQHVSESEDGDAFKLARQLMQGGDWKVFQPILDALKEQNPEGVRRVIVKYATTTILSAKSDKQAQRAAGILEMFATPFNTLDGITPLVTGVARLVFFA